MELRQFDWSDPSAGLARGEVDAAVVRLPFPGQERLTVRELFVEERGVLLPARHPLADSETVEFRDLWDEPFVAAGDQTGAWREHWLAVGERDGCPVRVGAVTSRPDEWLAAVAAAVWRWPRRRWPVSTPIRTSCSARSAGFRRAGWGWPALGGGSARRCWMSC
ncbi:LysR substrate-binding domain-containing protein [Actinomadura keratinilytica]